MHSGEAVRRRQSRQQPIGRWMSRPFIVVTINCLCSGVEELVAGLDARATPSARQRYPLARIEHYRHQVDQQHHQPTKTCTDSKTLCRAECRLGNEKKVILFTAVLTSRFQQPTAPSGMSVTSERWCRVAPGDGQTKPPVKSSRHECEMSMSICKHSD